MKQMILILLSTILFTCCNSKESPFFKFDKVEYYSIKIHDDDFVDLISSEKKSFIDSINVGIVFYNIPNTLNDSTFFFTLFHSKYTKNEINKNDFIDLNTIFSESNKPFINAKACAPIYRDILIFKFNNKVTGIAKICFQCKIAKILGSSKNCSNFGSQKEFSELFDILKEYKK